MGLLSFLKRNDEAKPAKPGRAAADSLDDVQQMRVRARRRLIGAAVLVGVAVIVFPLLFETQPRPIPVDLPIDIPRKDAAAPLAIPAPPTRVADAGQAAHPGQGQGIITETPEQAAADRPVPPPEAPAERPVERPAERQADKPVAKPADKPAEKKPEPRHDAKPEPKADTRPKAEAKPAKPEGKADKTESARVQALLDGRPGDKKPEAAASGARFIVQVGAYADSKAAQEARMKVERLGLKTYTQAVDTADGKRIRVRVGPFASRDEADKVAAKVRGGGLSTAVLTL